MSDDKGNDDNNDDDRDKGDDDRDKGDDDRDNGDGDRDKGDDDRDKGDGDGGEPESSKPPKKPAIPAKSGLPIALAITIATGAVLKYAFAAEQAGTWSMLLAMFGAYLPFTALAVFYLHKDGALAKELRPKQGDLTFGAFVGGVMYGGAMAVRQLFLGADSPRSWWVARIYLQLGDTSNNRMLYVGLAVLVIAAMEELTWRGLVMRGLRAQLGPMRAWLLSSVLYGVSHLATLNLLAHPVAGPNPLVVAAALGGGLVWGHLYNRTGRLAPSLFAHALFTWAIVDFPLWRP